MIQKIKKVLHLPMKHRCCICGEKLDRTNLSKFDLSSNENSVLRLLQGRDEGSIRDLSNSVFVCDKCQIKFEGIRRRINNTLEDESPIVLLRDTLLLENGKRIRSGWHKSKDACEDDLKTLARFYEVKEVVSIEFEMSEVEDISDSKIYSIGMPKGMQKIMTPPEYIYRLWGYIPL